MKTPRGKTKLSYRDRITSKLSLKPLHFNIDLDAQGIQNIIPNCIFFAVDIILFFNLILDIQKTIPNCMLYVDDVVLIEKSKGFGLSRSKAYMHCNFSKNQMT